MPDKFLKDVKLIVPMLPDMELAVSKTAESLAELIDFNKNQVDEIKQALIEACINAMEHSRSRDRRIFLHFKLFAHKLQVTVSDLGEGMDVEVVEKKRKRNNEGLTKRGWGLKLIEHYMDDVEIESGKNGTKLIMTKETIVSNEKGAVNE